MTPRVGSQLPVLSPGRVLVPADPHRRLECFLVDVFPTGFDLHTQFPLPVDELIAAEVEDHLVLADVKKCELHSGRFHIELERLYALPQDRLDDEAIVDPEGKLRLVLEEFLRVADATRHDDGEGRNLLERARAALARVSPAVVAAVCSAPKSDVAPAPTQRFALVRKLPMPLNGPSLNGSAAVNGKGASAVDGKAAPAHDPVPGLYELAGATLPEPTAEPLDSAVDLRAAMCEHADENTDLHLTETTKRDTQATVEAQSARTPIHWKFTFAETRPEPQSEHAAPAPGWQYHFVPAPLAPRAPQLRDMAKETIERL